MSDRTRVALVGATGLVGSQIIAASVAEQDLTLLALARRSVNAPIGAPVTAEVVAERWEQALASFRPQVLICALGTTWRAAGRSEAAFRAVDHDLVLGVAAAALRGGARRMVMVSSVGAAADSGSFYLKVKGQTEEALRFLAFQRLDILRPGLLRGQRTGERRVAERAAIALSPLTDRLLPGAWRRFRSVRSEDVARAALALSRRTEAGVFLHHNDAIVAAAAERMRQIKG